MYVSLMLATAVLAWSACTEQAESTACTDIATWNNPDCPRHVCATLFETGAFETREDAVACCVDAEGQGIEARYFPQHEVLDDPEGMLSYEAATCVAQSWGLPSGRGICGGFIWEGDWIVSVDMRPCVPEIPASTYAAVRVDGVTGDFRGDYVLFESAILGTTRECPESPPDFCEDTHW